MTKKSGTAHVVVDGSNIATEGRSMPTLEQLNEAVTSFMEDHPDALITVVVDATFGHRIPRKEAKEYEAGIANNELVAPPAGAVGRGDAFVLGIADKANATVLSNDSFQEFHGEYSWLFDEGRLVGGKPVPHVGWVFVERVPVRGPVSRKATRSPSGRSARTRKVSKAATAPMPVPTEPPPASTPAPAQGRDKRSSSRSTTPKASESVNELMPFLNFVEHHPVGTSVNGTIDSYSSHGAYVAIGDEGVRAYLPLRLISDPPPRSARKVLTLGESTTLVVVSYAPERRSIDCAVPDMADAAIAALAEGADSENTADGASAVSEASESETPAVEAADTAEGVPTRRSTRKRSAAKKATPASDEPSVESSVAGESGEAATPAAADGAAPAPATKSRSRKSAAKKTPAKKSTAKKSTAKKSTAKKSTATTTEAKSAAVKKVPAKKSAAKKAPAKKSPAKEAPAKQKAAAKKAPAKRKAAANKKAPAKKKAAAKKTAQNSSAAAPSSEAAAG